MTKVINLNNIFLFSCDGMQNHDAFKAIDAQSSFANKPFDLLKDIKIVPDTTVYVKSPKIKKGTKNIAPWKSSANGMLKSINNNFQNTSPVYLGPADANNIKFFFPPTEAIQMTWAANKVTWRKEIAEYFSKNEEFARSLQFIEIEPSQLKMPEDTDANTEVRKKYDEIIQNHNGQKIQGFLIAQAKGICLVFSDEIFNGATIKVKRKNGSTIQWGEKKDQEIFTVQKMLDKDPNDPLYSTFIFAKPGTDLPANELYTFEITSSKAIEKSKLPLLSESIIDKKGHLSYKLQTKITFPMSCNAGLFDMVMGDPISVEESLINQFPNKYSHMVELAKGKGDWDPNHDKVLLKDLKLEDASLKAQIDKTVNKIKVAHTIAKFGTGLASEDWGTGAGRFKIGRMLLSTFIKSFSEDQHNSPHIAKSIDLFFNTASFVSDGKKLHGQLKIFDAFRKQSSWGKAAKFLIHADNVNNKLDAAEEAFKTINGITGKLADADKKLILKEIVGSHNVDDLITTKFPKEMGFLDKAGKGLAYLDAALSIYDLAIKSMEVYGQNKQCNKILGDYREYIEIYQNEYLKLKKSGSTWNVHVPCRTAIQQLETMRQSHCVAELDLSDKEKAALKQAVAALGAGLACFPPTALIGAVIGIAMAGYDLVCQGIDLANHFFHDGVAGYDPEMIKLIEVTKSLEEENRKEFPEIYSTAIIGKDEENKKYLSQWGKGGKYNIELQHRLRAEALSGLFSLITRAATRIGGNDFKGDFRKEFDEKMKIYNIEKYINDFILNDQWTQTVNDSLTISMDEIWLFSEGSSYLSKNGTAANDIYAQTLLDKNNNGLEIDLDRDILEEFEEKLQDESDAWFWEVDEDEPNKMLDFAKSHGINPFHYIGQSITPDKEIKHGVARVNFQQMFPIHNIDSDSLNDMCYKMRSYFSEIKPESIAYTCVYYRDPSNKNTPLTNWEALSLDADSTGWFDDIFTSLYSNCEKYQKEKLHPFHEIRILVVFEENKDNKYSGTNYPIKIQINRYDGANLTGPVYKKQTKVLTKSDLLDNEYGYEGRIGCVFHPFYDIGQWKHGGIKPMHAKGTFESLKNFFSKGDIKDLDLGATPEECYKAGMFDIMEYGIQLIVGNHDEYDKHLKLCAPPQKGVHGTLSDAEIRKKYVEDKPTRLYLGIDTSIHINKKTNKHYPTQKLLLDWEFLHSRAKEMPSRELFTPNGQFISLPMIRFGGGNTSNASNKLANDFIPVSHAYIDQYKIISPHIPQKNGQLNLEFEGKYSEKNKIHYGHIYNEVSTGKINSRTLKIIDFDWDTQIDFAHLIFSAGDKFEKHISEWEKYMLNWKDGIAVDVSMNRVDRGIDDNGPSMRSKLCYLGKFKDCIKDINIISANPRDITLNQINQFFDSHKFFPNKNLPQTKALGQLLQKLSSKTQDIDLWRKVLFANLSYFARQAPVTNKSEIFIFASIHTPAYIAPGNNNNDEIKSIRPFGNDIADTNNWFEDNEYYKYYLNNFCSVNTKFGLSTVDNKNANNWFLENCIYQFSPPKNSSGKEGIEGLQDKSHPWNKNGVMTEKELEEWIIEKPEMVVPKCFFIGKNKN